MSNGLSTADELADLSGMNEAPTRNSLNVRFFVEPQLNEERSKKEGSPKYDNVEVIEIRVPGERDFLRHPATPQDRQQYARQYERDILRARKANDATDGTPLTLWPPMMLQPGQVEEARAMGVLTVEQLASISDVVLQRFGPGWIQLRQHARDWVKTAKDGAVTVKLRSELDAALVRIKTLEDMLAKQAHELHRDATVPAPVQYVNAPSATDEKIAQLEALVRQFVATPAVIPPTNGTAPKRRGRPPKAKPPEPAPQS